MDLSFKTEINNKPTQFVEKIIVGIFEKVNITAQEIAHAREQYFRFFGKPLTPRIGLKQKYHSIRADKGGRWEQGKDIHFVINARTKNRFVFAPILPVISTQKIKIVPITDEKHGVWIDERKLTISEIETLATNDGFDTVMAFWDFFKDDFEGTLIHWTPLRYEGKKEVVK